MRNLISLALCLILAGCVHEIKPTPNVVIVPQKYYVPIPDDLTKPCPIDQPKDPSDPVEAREIARLRALSLKDCNTDKDKIHAIQGTVVPTAPPTK